jgi:hypothetical protein
VKGWNRSKYFGTTLIIQNSIQEEIKSKLKSGNACYKLAQNLLSSRLLSENIIIKIYRTIILSVVLYGREIWPLTFWEERLLRVFENMVFTRIFGPKKGVVTRGVETTICNVELKDLFSSPNII